MREHLSKIIVVVLLVVVVGVPFVLRPADPQAEADSGAGPRLIIFSPHNEQIRYELARGFNEWRREQGKPPVTFDWRAGGGTSDLRRIVMSQLKAKADKGRENEGVGGDLFFGGGEYEHDALANGVTVTRNGRQVQIPAIVPVDLRDGMLELEDVYPEPTIGGERLYREGFPWFDGFTRSTGIICLPKDAFKSTYLESVVQSEWLYPEGFHWYGAVVSSFGIIYNRDVLGMKGLDEPRTWSDLQTPAYFQEVALSDPAHSGSIAATYEVILQRHGWTDGWRLLRRVYANTRYFTSSSAQIPVDVSAGEAAAGMCIDFYGRFQAGQVGGNRVGYVDPQHMTATTSDPIAVLRGAPHPELAREFLEWVLSKDGQRLWQREVGAPDGPEKYALRRQPVRRDLYEDADETEHWTDPDVNPFATAHPLPEGTPGFYNMVAPVSHAMAIDVHDELVAAWSAIQNTPKDDPRRARMLTLFDAMPPLLTVDWPDDAPASEWRAAVRNDEHPRHDEAVAAVRAMLDNLSKRYENDPSQFNEDRLAWLKFFRGNYQKIVAIADE